MLHSRSIFVDSLIAAVSFAATALLMAMQASMADCMCVIERFSFCAKFFAHVTKKNNITKQFFFISCSFSRDNNALQF